MAETSALLNALLGESVAKLDEKLQQFEKELDEKLEKTKTKLEEKVELIEGEKPLIVNLGSIEKPKNKSVHKKFKTVINILKSQKRIAKNIMLVGEAGSGKTHLVETVAEALKLQFYPMSVGLQTTKSDLLGFVNATGYYVTSPVREAYENGGVLLLDEFDAAHAGVVTILNSLLANGHCSFPDKVVNKHKDFICICACNTYGKGANTDYVGRNRLDAATLDRFIIVDVDYDTKLEKKLCGNDTWYEIIKKVRKNASDMGIKCIISPRASMNGADLLDEGFSIKETLEMTVLKGLDKDARTKLLKDVDITGKKETVKETSGEIKNEVWLVADINNCTFDYSTTEDFPDISLVTNNNVRITFDSVYRPVFTTTHKFELCQDNSFQGITIDIASVEQEAFIKAIEAFYNAIDGTSNGEDVLVHIVRKGEAKTKDIIFRGK